MIIGDEGQPKFVKGVNGECFKASGAAGLIAALGSYDEPPIIDLTKTRPDYRVQCPSPEFARGFHGREGQFINALGLICGPLVALKPGAIPPSQAKQFPSALPTAPTIDLPQGFIVKGKGAYKITPSPHLNGTHAQIQLKWLNPPANLQGKGVDFYNYEVPMSLIAGPSGIPAPENYLAVGTWEITVRINQPKVGDWSQPVRFEYYLQNPAVTTKPGAPFRREGGSKDTTSGTGVILPQTTPSQGLGAGPGLIRPRGTEEEKGEAPTGPEKKP